MQIIDINQENIAREHICCAITEKKGESCVPDKKAWLTERFAEGLMFKRLDVRGKVFIEYIPAEAAWYPVEAPGYMHIDCFWVSGQYKGHGHATALLNSCIEDAKAKGKLGLTAITTVKKQPFVMDGKFLKHHGFEVADTAGPQYELLYLPFAKDAPKPAFKQSAKEARIDEQGMVIYYTDQCPFANTYALRAQETARGMGRELTLHRIDTRAQAQQSPSPSATYSFFYNGEFITNEILAPAKVEKFIQDHPEG